MTLALAAIASACSTSAAAPKGTPSIAVVTGLYPLAQAIEQIGGTTVTVTDVVPAGDDPTTYQLSPAQVGAVQRSALVVEVGGLQPSLDAAAAGARTVLDLRAKLATKDAYLWLDPTLMRQAVSVIEVALAGANPGAAASYRANAEGFGASVTSTGIDYQSTLATCPRQTIATANDAFAGLAQRYGLTDQVLGAGAAPSPELVAAGARRVTAAGLTTVFSEPFVSSATVAAVAAAAGAKVRALDPLTGPPPGGWPAKVDYIQLMESNLAALSSALGCPDTSTGM